MQELICPRCGDGIGGEEVTAVYPFENEEYEVYANCRKCVMEIVWMVDLRQRSLEDFR